MTSLPHLAHEHYPLAVKIVRSMKRHYRSCVTEDDLLGPASLGLVQAALRYDATRGLTFRTFASHRIRGAVLDYLRSIDHLTRGQRKAVKQSGAPEPMWGVSTSAPETQFAGALASEAWRAVATLCLRDQEIITLYYREQLTMREIGDRLRINESRVSQLHSRAIGLLRRSLHGLRDD